MPRIISFFDERTNHVCWIKRVFFKTIAIGTDILHWQIHEKICGNYHWRICYNLYKVYNFRFQFLKSNFHECNYHVMKVWETSLYYARILKIYITCQYQINKWKIFWIFKTGWIFNPVQDGPYQGCSGMGPYLKFVTQIPQW